MTTINCLSCEKPCPYDFHLQGICEDCSPPEVLAERDLKREQALASRISKSGLPLPLHDNPWPDTEPAKAAREWAKGERNGLVLTGEVGVGKTYLAGCATWEMLKRRSVSWVSVAALMTRLKASFDDEDRARSIYVVQGEGPLVLDDLDKANPTEFGKEILFAAIDQRIIHGSPLLVTTNLPMGALADRMGDPIASRLAGLKPIEMVGTDRRLAA